MDFRLAVMHDLPQLKSVYRDIIQNMNQNQIEIWDEIYPCEFFSEDIQNNRQPETEKSDQAVFCC